MSQQCRQGVAGVRAVQQASAVELVTTHRHARVPTECALCGAADFSAVVEVISGAACLLHWVSPPPGWFLLREVRPERGAPLLHARCASCMDQLFALRR
jgi:hypothetical protein